MSNYRSNLHSPKRPDSLSEAQAIIRQQAYDLKLLSNDNQLKAQQIDMLSEKIRELEESTNGYQTQVSVLEESLNISNQEFKAKWQAEQTQTLKLSKNNKALLRTNQQLQQYIKELEQRQTTLQEALQEILGEVQGLKQRSAQAQQAVMESKEILGQKQKELEMADATIVRSRIENEELKKDIGELADKNNELEEKLEDVEKNLRKTRSENEELQRKLGNVNEKNSGLEKELEASKKELEQIGDVEARYILLKGSHERDTVEISNVRHSYELLKRKYEDLQHEHESKMIVFEQVEAQIKLQAGSIEGMERQLEKFKTAGEQKEEENAQLVDRVNELEETLKTVEANMSRRVKEMVGLMENQVVDDIEEEIEDVNIRSVMMGIVRLNRDVGELSEKLLVSEEEYKYLEKEITTLAQEKEEIAVKHDELARECERLAELEESARKEKEDLQIRFDMELERLTNIVHENEGHLDSAIQSKENDIQILLDEREKLRELLETQEANARETKSKFLALAEEASLQKGRLERISYVITAMLKVFLNLLVKFKLLGKHKDFLGKYFWKYRTLRQSLEERPLAGKGEEKDSAAAAIRKFKRAVVVVKIIARLRRLKRKGRDTNVDEYEVMNSLDNMPDELRRFICELFKYDRLGIEKGLLKDIQASISSFDGLNENSIIGGIISKIGLLKSPEVSSILSEWSARGVNWSSMEGYDREYASRSPYTGGSKRTEGFSSGGKGREYYKRTEDLPRQTGSKEQKKGHSDFIKEFDSLREDSGHWTTNQSKLDEISEIEDGPPLNERVNKTYGSNTFSTRRDEMKMQKQAHGQGQRINTAGSIDRNSLWGGPLSSLDEYSTPGFNSPGEGNLSERKPGSRKYESIGL